LRLKNSGLRGPEQDFRLKIKSGAGKPPGNGWAPVGLENPARRAKQSDGVDPGNGSSPGGPADTAGGRCGWPGPPVRPGGPGPKRDCPPPRASTQEVRAENSAVRRRRPSWNGRKSVRRGRPKARWAGAGWCMIQQLATRGGQGLVHPEGRGFPPSGRAACLAPAAG